MPRKRWTANELITDDLLKFREKRKWQLALRRYVIEKNRSPSYAYYFGLPIEDFRLWISSQFTEGLNWDNFGQQWQLDQVVPLDYFDFEKEEDLRLCWNFTNIRVRPIELRSPNQLDLLSLQPYFNQLYKTTGYSVCRSMAEKLSMIQEQQLSEAAGMQGFLLEHRQQLEAQLTLNQEEFNRLNEGTSLTDLLLEKEILKKFG